MRRNKQEVTEMYRQMCGLRRQGESRAEDCGGIRLLRFNGRPCDPAVRGERDKEGQL